MRTANLLSSAAKPSMHASGTSSSRVADTMAWPRSLSLRLKLRSRAPIFTSASESKLSRSLPCRCNCTVHALLNRLRTSAVHIRQALYVRTEGLVIIECSSRKWYISPDQTTPEMEGIFHRNSDLLTNFRLDQRQIVERLKYPCRHSFFRLRRFNN